MQGDMIFVYKIIRGDNQSLRDLFTINEPKTRGISFKLYKPLVQTTIRKHFYSIRVMNNWNSLPYKVVNAVSLDSFHSKSDNAWEDKKYMCFNKNIAESSKKYYAHLVKSFLLFLADVCLFWVSLYTASPQKRNLAVKESGNNLHSYASKKQYYKALI